MLIVAFHQAKNPVKINVLLIAVFIPDDNDTIVKSLYISAEYIIGF